MISATQEKILRYLAEYKYLTVSQFRERLNISITPVKVRKNLNDLKRQGFTNRITHMAVPRGANKESIVRRVRHEDMHYLTAKGANLLDTTTELSIPDIRYARKLKYTLSNDYFHRLSTVSMNISFDRWARTNSFVYPNYLVYYDKRGYIKKGEGFKAETRLELENKRHFTPDVILNFTNKKDQFLFVLELYHGNRSDYAFTQLKKLFWLIENTTKVSDLTGIQKTPRVLCVFDNTTLLNNVIKRIKEDEYFSFDEISELIYFNLDVNVWRNFGSRWINTEGEIIQLSQLKKVKF